MDASGRHSPAGRGHLADADADAGAATAGPGVAYDRAGTGPPLLLVHGLGGERHVWAPVIERLAAERELITVDLPGFGDSAPLADGATADPAALAQAIADLLDELGLARIDVAGNSLGGWVTLELAKLGRAASVTAIAPAGLWPAPLNPKPYVMRGVARALRPILGAMLWPAATRRLALAASVAHPERVPRAAAQRMILAYANAPGFVAVSTAMRAGRFTGGEHIRVPVTIAWCERDRLISRPRHMPVSARELVLVDCGHVPMYDDPDAVARVLRTGSAVRSGVAL